MVAAGPFIADKPRRRHKLVAVIEADILEGLVSELDSLSQRAERGALTTGVTGSPAGGAIYHHDEDTEQTKDGYFAEIEAWLRERSLAEIT